MRYLGNKESIMPEINKLLCEKGLIGKKYKLFDAFCGSGAVSDNLKDKFDLIINDNLKWSVIYTKGRIVAPKCTFDKLGFDPFEFLNSNKKIEKNFMYNNYSPGGSARMYFTKENAGRIDYFRSQIEKWYEKKLLTEDEYCYLLSCLIESVSDVSNTAGVYGAFLKKWDSRALKPIQFDKVDFLQSDVKSLAIYNDKIERMIEDVDCDILYLDPPYTQNQYGTQYHLLETLILNDNPEISKITGSRSTSPMRSDWSKDYKCHILLDEILYKTKAKYIILSYNNDGFMSKEYIEACMKRYGKKETYKCKKISYKKYQNWKSANTNEHFEYLFYIEKKDKKDIIYESPLNYIGSKFKIVGEMKKYLPEKINHFVDIFGGGFNVGCNIDAKNIIYNDLNYFVKELIQSFYVIDTYQYILYLKKIINKYKLEKGNAESYNKIRTYYNSLPKEKRDPRLFLAVIMYGYQQQIRFNGNHEFNNPVGMRWFNDKVLEKLISFSRHIKEKDYVFESKDYIDIIETMSYELDDFIYFDPPYKMTTGSYNDGKRGFKGWNNYLEKELFQVIDSLTERNIKCMLSYVLEHNGKFNNELNEWINSNGYKLIELGDVLGISGSRRKEVLVINYDI